MSTRPLETVLLCLMAALVLSLALFGSTTLAGPIRVLTVGRHGCDFASIQEAIDEVDGGLLLRLIDPVHTEAAILITKTVFIIGNGADKTILQANASTDISTDRIFRVEEGAMLLVEGVTMRHGHPTMCPKGGGALLNFGTTWLLRCILRENLGQCGGAIQNEGTLYAIDSTFLDNEATGGHNREGNRARGSGGAVKNVTGFALFSGCTIAGNRANIHGGGLKGCCDGEMRLVNCTISGNEATRQGGGIHTRGALQLVHCTVVSNVASAYLARMAGVVRAGGIYLDGPTALEACLIAGNDGQDIHVGEDGGLTRNRDCLVGDGSIDAAWTGDPALSGLGDHGGATRSHLPLADSIIVDAITECVVAIDQRGVPRPQGPGCDLGAVERREDDEN